MAGFGCELLAYDPYPNPRIQALGGRYLALDALLAESDIVSLHCPLTADTRHLIDAPAPGDDETRRDADQYRPWRPG
ncbi:fermentative D-lactate dehydrogenase [Pseudomonas aeruginosa]|nr:fermentative D-lactate dehydrogenase [Pseudomonas aeruginosa]